MRTDNQVKFCALHSFCMVALYDCLHEFTHKTQETRLK